MGKTPDRKNTSRVTNYTRGRNLEYKVKKELEAQGYLVIRSSGSHSPFDLIAMRMDEIRFIQLKSRQQGQTFYRIDAEYETVVKEEFWQIARRKKKNAANDS